MSIIINPYIFNNTPIPYDVYTKLILHFDELDESISHPTTFVGTAQLDTSESKFGGSSLLLDGNSDYVTVPDSDDFDFGSENFTIDFWIRTTTVTGNRYYFSLQGATSSERELLAYSVGDDFTFDYYYASSSYQSVTFADVLSTNTWIHLAIVRDGANLDLYVNGTKQTTHNISTRVLQNSGYPFYIGTCLNTGGIPLADGINGHLDEFRVSKGIARWTANFTPPTEAYS